MFIYLQINNIENELLIIIGLGKIKILNCYIQNLWGTITPLCSWIIKTKSHFYRFWRHLHEQRKDWNQIGKKCLPKFMMKFHKIWKDRWMKWKNTWISIKISILWKTMPSSGMDKFLVDCWQHTWSSMNEYIYLGKISK